jgi:pilus assembly protein CpaC
MTLYRASRTLLIVVALSPASHDARAAQAQAGVPPVQPVALRPDAVQTVIKSQHLRLPFAKDIQRVAVGDSDILAFEIVHSRELLVLGRDTGRTTLIVWFTDGTLREYLFAVHRDLSVLQATLKRVDPSIEVESAPDRDAIILTGTVPNITVSQTAEAIARDYLAAGETRRGLTARPFLSATPAPPPVSPDAAAGAAAPGAPGQPPGPAPLSTQPETSRLQGEVQPTGTIINLLRLETLPPLPEEKITAAIQSIGGRTVSVRRILKGNVRNDGADTLVLEGSVPNQIALVRILEVASQIFAGQNAAEAIRVIADEAGALAGRSAQGGQAGQGGLTSLGAGGSALGLSSGSRGARLTNDVTRNVGRAKAIEVANGRILSFIEVGDLPQVRVAIRLMEVNRSRLRSFTPESALLLSDFRQPSLEPARSAAVVQGAQAARVGASGAAIQEVLSFLGGALTNELQFAGAHAAVDTAVSLLERQGIVHTLSSPALTVLSGEIAQFQVGGEIPITIGLVPVFAAGGAGGVTVQQNAFSAVDFVPFGIQLGIRPLVGDDDTITLDVQPQVVLPDATLTDTIRQSSGTNPQTTAFQTRALRTSSRLQDGQTLLIGGLRTDSINRNTARTPGLGDIPALGWLFKSYSRNDETVDLVVMVNPVIVRTRIPDAGLWAFPERSELLRSIALFRSDATIERKNP